MTPTEISELNRFTDRLRELHRRSTIEAQLIPTNLVDERARVVAALERGASIAPRFSYPHADGSAEAFAALADALDPAAGSWHTLHAETAAASARRAAAIARHDADAVTEATTTVYGRPTPEVLDQARRILKTADTTDVRVECDIDADQAAALLTDSLRGVGLTDWTVRVDPDMAARMSVRSSDRLVRVRVDSRFSREEVRRLTVHELGTHVTRSHNGSRQALALLGIGVSGYLATEEGLAVVNENHLVGPDPVAQRRYALRVVGVDLALRLGFADVLAALVTYIPPEAAFDLTFRVKRGISDTESPGAYTKDHVYLTGSLAVSAHLSTSPDDGALLASGKFGLDHLPAVRQLVDASLWVPPELLPSAFTG